MKTPMKTSTSWIAPSEPVVGASGSRKELMPTSTAARPTKLCRIATSSGMPVISTVRARQAPMAAPIAMATTMSARVDPRPRQWSRGSGSSA